jgi:hypothetical protein
MHAILWIADKQLLITHYDAQENVQAEIYQNAQIVRLVQAVRGSTAVLQLGPFRALPLHVHEPAQMLMETVNRLRQNIVHEIKAHNMLGKKS